MSIATNFERSLRWEPLQVALMHRPFSMFLTKSSFLHIDIDVTCNTRPLTRLSSHVPQKFWSRMTGSCSVFLIIKNCCT